MATNRRVFLEVVGAGAAGATINLACVGIVGDTGLSTHDPAPGSGGDTGSGGATSSGGQTGSGGSGAGGDGTGGISGQGGSGAGGRTGTGGAKVDAGVPPRDASVDTGAPVLGPGDLAAGSASAIAVGTLNAIPGTTAAIGRDSMGLYAITLICTHQGCTAAPAGATGARQVNCPCHGSQFDANGAVIRGPATRPLVHFAVTVDAAGNVVIHTSSQVAATARVMP